ncbi:CUB and sushi domain-containing protein 3-like isoform X4 [Acropora palmata]|uniref:CUB and sushi domain-containing protein 3-like isoform X4 n=1 Tax=Acropora palmata TaxID=6131 RepID=UPI003DA1A99F
MFLKAVKQSKVLQLDSNMKHLIVVNLLTFLALQWLSKTQATHFRHAIITWAPANSYSNTLILRFRMAFRRSFSSSYNCDQSIINSGALRGSGGSWIARYRCSSGYCSSGTIANTGFQCTDFSVDEDWTMGENNFTYTFSSVSKEWIVSYQGCCWISSLVKYPDGNWLVSTTVNLTRRADTGRINSSPVSKSPAIIRFEEGCPQSFRIPVEDPDDDVVKCRWAIYSESSRQTDSFPHGVIDERACLLQYNGRNRTAGTYAVALTLEDFPEGTTDFTSVTRFSAVGLQFLVIITTRSGSCNDVPLFTKSTPSDGECTEVQIGSAYRAVIEVKLQDLSRHVTEIVTSSPVGMQLTPLRQDALLGIFYRNITWYPSQYQVGQQLFCFKAKDSEGSESEWRCITILVGLSNTPRIVLGTQWPRYPSSQFGTGFMWLSIQFDRVIKKPRTSAYVRLVLLPSEHTVYKVDTLSRNVVISANKTALLFALPKAALSMRGSYAILIDRGAVVGLGCSFDGPPTPGISSPKDWGFNVYGICSTGYSLDPPYYRSCVDVNECGNPSRKKRYAWWGPVTSTSSSPTPTFSTVATSSPGVFASASPPFQSGSCGYNFTDRQGNLTSPNYPFSYPNNLNCLWTITATPGDYIYLYFTYFYVQGYYYYWWYGRYGNYGYNSYCSYDYVEVFDLNYPSSFIKVRGCGYQSPWCVKSKSQVMHIRFVTNSIYSFTGFTANYTVYRTPPVGDNCLSLNPYASSSTILHATPTFSTVATSSPGVEFSHVSTSTPGVSASASPPFPSGSCGYNFTDRQGNLTSPNYPFSYPNNLNCLWTITATPGDYIYLYFTYFYVQGYYNYYYYYGQYGRYGYNSYCPYDYVEMFDLNYPSSFVKVRGCGYQSSWCVKSKSHVMHIRFVTNSIYSYRGFTANYTVYRTPPVGDNCLSLNPYASSSTIFSATPTFSQVSTSTPGVYASASPPSLSGLALECFNHSYLDDSVRRQGFYNGYNGYYQCDNNLAFGWYRFGGAAGTQMPTKCVGQNRCSSHAPGWLNASHPSVEDGIVTAKVCFHWTSGCCTWSTNIRVRNCSGFYVYELRRPPACWLRYCGNGGSNQSITTSSPQTSPTPGTCVYNLTNPQGHFTSPNHPSPHQHYLNCFWTITAAPGDYIHLYFLYFHLEYGSSYCPYDYVEVTDPNYPTSSIKIKRCGYQSPWCVTSTSNVMYVRFVTDRSVAYSGFFASYTNHPNPFSGNCSSLNATQIQTTQANQSTTTSSPQTSPTPAFSPIATSTPAFYPAPTSTPGVSVSTSPPFPSGSCGYNFTDRQGNLTSPNYPYSYPNNLNCLWTITATPGDYIYLYFTYFYVQGYYNYYYYYGQYGRYGYNSYCPYDYVEIFDLNYPSSFIKVRGCGYQSPWCVKSKSHVVHIRFVTNSIYSYTGFRAHYVVYRNPPAGGNCLSLNPYASSSRIIQETPILSSASTSTSANNSMTRGSLPASPTPGSCRYNLVNPQGNFTSPNYPSRYPHNLNCLWTITAAPGYYIDLHFINFVVEGCPYDYVEVFDQNYPSTSIKVKSCGYRGAWCVTSTSKVLYVRFVTDSSVASSGFFASYRNDANPFSGRCTSLRATQIQATQRSSPIATPISALHPTSSSTTGVPASASLPFLSVVRESSKQHQVRTPTPSTSFRLRHLPQV